MKISIMQPTYLPWLGYFELMNRADRFVLLDNVPFSKQSHQQRNKIKTHQGTLMLTVPVMHKLGQLITDAEIDNRTSWIQKHWRSIQFAYQKAPFWSQFSPALAKIYGKTWTRLGDLNIALIRCLKEILGISTDVLLASELDAQTDEKIERLLNICKKLNGTLYYSPNGAREYLMKGIDFFSENGIQIEFQNFQHPVYPQLHGEFVPKLSVLDIIFNAGPRSLEIINEGSHFVA